MWPFAARSARSARRPAVFRPRFEPLEARENPAGGVLDTTFGSGGVAAVPANGTVNATAVQPDGKVLAVSTESWSGRSVASVTRLNGDGTPDATFGTGGTVRLAVGRTNYGTAVAIQPDGKVLVAGDAHTRTSLWYPDNQYAVARLNPNGTLDRTFGGANTGWWTSNPTSGEERVTRLAVVPSGGGFSIYAGGQAGLTTAAVVKLTAAGRPDTTYGAGGFATRTVVDSSTVLMAVTPSGRAVVRNGMSLYGFTPAGQTDAGFGTNGAVAATFAGKAIAAQGENVVEAGVRYQTGLPSAGVVTRYTPAGTVDPTFGVGGQFVGPWDPGATLTRSEFKGLAVAADGSLVIVGTAGRKDEAGVAHKGILLGRLSADGQPDATFGPVPDGSGLVIRYDQDPTLFGAFNAKPSVALDPAGNIVVGAGTQNLPNVAYYGAVVRFTGS